MKLVSESDAREACIKAINFIKYVIEEISTWSRGVVLSEDFTNLFDRCRATAGDIELSIQSNKDVGSLHLKLTSLLNISDEVMERISSSRGDFEKMDWAVVSIKQAWQEVAIVAQYLVSTNEWKQSAGMSLDLLEKLNQNVEVYGVRLKEISEQYDLFERQLEDIVKPMVGKAQSLMDEYSGAASYLENRKSEVDQLVGLIGRNSVAGSYKAMADGELRMANRLRVVAFMLMTAVILIIGYSLHEIATEKIDIPAALVRLAFTIALSVPAIYLTRESSKHRLYHYKFIQTSLDLNALGPYAASLPAERQHKLREDLAARIFGQQAGIAGVKDSYPVDIQEIILHTIDKIKEKNSSA